MRVLHFAQSFSPLSETFVYDYVTELERQGVDNHVVTFRRKNPQERPFSKVHVVDRPSRWHPRRLWHRALVPLGIGEARTSNWPLVKDRLADIARGVEPDVIHAHFGPAAVLIADVATRLDIPLVTTFYGYDISSLPSEDFWRAHYAKLWSTTDAVTVLSEEMKGQAIELGCPSDKLNVVHLSRDLSQFEYRSPSPPVRNVLFVGRLVAKKAPLDAVQAVERANEKGANLHLDLIGGGELRADIEQYVRDNNLTEVITIHGLLPNRDVQQWMRDADVFLLPSKTATNGDREGTPTVLVEAQAVGLPCVSTCHAGIPEMLPEENRELLTEEGDVDALADCLSSLTTCAANRLSCIAKRGREMIENQFSLESEVQKLRKVYGGTQVRNDTFKATES
jgi:colanic acid/amylovoran biosynthesis glycosyltransferase